MKPEAPSLKTTIFSVRFTAEEMAVLTRVAKAEDRPIAYIVRRATMEWLKQNGMLKR